MASLALKVGILYYGGTLVNRGGVSSGDLVSFVLYELQFASAVEVSNYGNPKKYKKYQFISKNFFFFPQAVMQHYPSVRKAIGAAEKIFEYIDRKPDMPADGHLEPQELTGHIRFKNVTFSYTGKTDSNSLVLKVNPPLLQFFIKCSFSGFTASVNTPIYFLLQGCVLRAEAW